MSFWRTRTTIDPPQQKPGGPLRRGAASAKYLISSTALAAVAKQGKVKLADTNTA
jgi:hypothetical protein